ncbi:MAG: beta-propeller domain-containing protein [Minicystis sp.]
MVRQVDLSGSLMAARRVGSTVHTVVADGDAPAPVYSTWPDDLETCGSKESVVRAKFARLKVENERKILASTWFPTIREKGVDKPLCGGLLRTAIGDGQAFTTVVSFDLRDDATPAVTATLQSRPGAVFASGNALYLSVVHQKRAAGKRWYSFYPSVDEVSEIHKFRIGESPRDTRYLGSGVVPGHVLNQFAMDEWYGYLRVATTRGRVPDPRVESVVSVLADGGNGNLVRVGAIEKIAPGEDIRAVRFEGDRGYVVTFKKTDPLFVMDLYHPAQPKILGELKIPGFSTYMHRIDPEHLLSIGFDADDHGSFAYFDGVILQLFDVKDPTDPKLIHKEKIGTRGSSSEAATNHLAFNYFAEKGLLAIPMTICEGGGDGRNGDQLAFSGLLVYDVSVAKGFTRLGGIDHGTKGVSCGTWWSHANSAVKRSIFLDELVYSIATDRLKVQRLGHFGEDLASIALAP